jgi:hypothetical protein
MPEPKRADCFPPAVPQCIAMGSSMESVHTAMSPEKNRIRKRAEKYGGYGSSDTAVTPKT